VPNQVKDLISSKEISGSYQNGIFTPSVYLDNIKKEIEDFFALNSYLPYDFVKKIMNIGSTPAIKN